MAIKKQFLITVIWQRWLARERERKKKKETQKYRNNDKNRVNADMGTK